MAYVHARTERGGTPDQSVGRNGLLGGLGYWVPESDGSFDECRRDKRPSTAGVLAGGAVLLGAATKDWLERKQEIERNSFFFYYRMHRDYRLP